MMSWSAPHHAFFCADQLAQNCFNLERFSLPDHDVLSTPLISINKVRMTHNGNYSRFVYAIRANVGTPSCAHGMEHDMQVYAKMFRIVTRGKEMIA